jgi:NAD(P)-dependent dehydrogenase (short-subunit alcohol dehydrogenase family)
VSHPPFDYSSKAVIVTGGCRGVGRGIAVRFLEAGADVVICCRHRPDDLPAAGGREAVFVEADVRDPDQVARVIEASTDAFGRLDVVVNNAGGAPPSEAATASPRFAESVVRLNLLAPLFVAQQANALMQTQDQGGVIVNIASVSGLRPSPGAAAYGAAKAGLLNLTQTLAIEWAPKVRVVALTPGMVLTEQADLYYGDEAAQARVAATVPAGRLAEPADVADSVLFLASPFASYASGTNLVLHGGGERPAFLRATEG